MNLYAIAQEYAEALAKLEESDLPPEVIKDTLDSISGDFEDKAVNLAAYILNLEADASAIGEAEKKMAARRKAADNKAARLREYVQAMMEHTGITEIARPAFVLKLKKNPESVEITDDAAVPLIYKPMKEVVMLDRLGIKAALRSGETVPGAQLKSGTRLEIK